MNVSYIKGKRKEETLTLTHSSETMIVPASAFKYDTVSRTFSATETDLKAFPASGTGTSFRIKGRARTIDFIYDMDDMQANEHYDGEMTTYVSTGINPEVRCVIMNY